RWNPARDLAALEVDRLNRMFDAVFTGEPLTTSAWVPAVDIYETADKDVVVKVEVPNMKREDIKVTFENNVLTVEGASNNGLDFEHYGKLISKDKKIAVGVISHRTLQIERPEEVAALIRKALKYIEPERLILSSDCGFGRQAASRMHAFYKMVSLVRGANMVRKELGLDEVEIPATDPQRSMVPVAS
ncbi:MAG: Hsp20 family protein, partial [Alphaproteobacteria bacterium]